MQQYPGSSQALIHYTLMTTVMDNTRSSMKIKDKSYNSLISIDSILMFDEVITMVVCCYGYRVGSVCLYVMEVTRNERKLLINLYKMQKETLKT